MGCCKCCCILLIVLTVIIAASLGLFAGLFPYPSHASCKVDWEFGKSCDTVESKLISKIRDWTGSSCDGKQQCGYKFLGVDGNIINGERVTPITEFVDKFNFTFVQRRAECFVTGISESESSYAIIDFGYNYCNLKNLIIGTRLDEDDEKYKEFSENSICTMYTIAHCNLY